MWWFHKVNGIIGNRDFSKFQSSVNLLFQRVNDNKILYTINAVQIGKCLIRNFGNRPSTAKTSSGMLARLKHNHSDSQKSLTWSETVGLRTRPVWDQKKSVLVLHVWCSFVKHDFVTLVVIMILNDTTFQVLFIVSLYCAWNITTVEINSGVHLLKSKICKFLCLLPVVLVLVLLFWIWSWSWSYYVGLGLGLKNLVLFTSLSEMQIVTCARFVMLGRMQETTVAESADQTSQSPLH